MEFQKLFEKFNLEGHLLLPDTDVAFKEIPWSKHPVFAGVELKHILTARQSGGDFSFHLVRIAPGCKIGGHVHEKQLETHEVLAGKGVCINNGTELKYEPGIISIFRPECRMKCLPGLKVCICLPSLCRHFVNKQ